MTFHLQSASELSATSSSLLERVKARDPIGWEQFCGIYGPCVFRWARQCALQPSDAADIMQEVFQVVAAKIGTLRTDRSGDSLRRWLWTITKNKVLDRRRANHRRPVAAGGSDAYQHMQQLPDDPPDEKGRAHQPTWKSRLVRQFLTQLRTEFEQRTWHAFWRTAVDGLPASKVAQEFGMTQGAVRQAKYRVLQRLRRELEGVI